MIPCDPVGRFIRKTSLDELPQLLNVVFKGNLSLVGPRPHAVQGKLQNRLFDETVDGYFARHRVKPGITGWAVIFHGQHNWMEKVAGGWDLSGIVNWHSGFPFNPTYSSNCAVFENYSGCQTSYRPAKYLGGAGLSQGTDTFKTQHGNFPNAGTTYFTMPTQTGGTLWPNDGTAPIPGPLPSAPGVGRNAFYGPQYFDTDMTVTKAFGLPTMRVIGESARLELRANAYNLFNKLNLTGVDSGINDNFFGRANGVLGARVVNLEAHFKF